MNMEYAVAAVLAIMAVAFWKEKGSWLFAGYNTMSEKEKQNYDHKKLCRLMSCLTGFCAVMFLADGILGLSAGGREGLIGSIIFAAAVITVILANTVCRKRKKK